MAQFLDVKGLQTVVQNVKNLIKLPVLQIYSFVTTITSSYIKNSVAPSVSSIVYNSATNKIFAKYGSYYYTQWHATSTYESSSSYGTTSSTGVTPNDNSFIYCISTKYLYLYKGGLKDVLQQTQTPTWTTMWTNTSSSLIQQSSPFCDDEGIITKVERRTDENGEYVWRLSAKNSSSSGKEYRLECGDKACAQYLIYLKAGYSGTFFVRTPHNQTNWYFNIVGYA